jgi:hypothetical protein
VHAAIKEIAIRYLQVSGAFDKEVVLRESSFSTMATYSGTITSILAGFGPFRMRHVAIFAVQQAHLLTYSAASSFLMLVSGRQ